MITIYSEAARPTYTAVAPVVLASELACEELDPGISTQPMGRGCCMADELKMSRGSGEFCGNIATRLPRTVNFLRGKLYRILVCGFETLLPVRDWFPVAHLPQPPAAARLLKL